MRDADTESAIRLQLAMQLGMGKGTSTTEYLASKEMTSMVETIERLTRELDETRAEVTRLNALINTPQPVITGIWRRSVI